MTRIFLAVFYYIIAIASVIFFQRRFQSDGGPGLNIYAFIIISLCSCYMLYSSLRKSVLDDDESYWPVFIHLAGICLIIYLIFFDQAFMVK
ncbi:MAG: hypothetical protein ABIN91_14270 [Mucilaginibacter sp.]